MGRRAFWVQDRKKEGRGRTLPLGWRGRSEADKMQAGLIVLVEESMMRKIAEQAFMGWATVVRKLMDALTESIVCFPCTCSLTAVENPWNTPVGFLCIF